MAAFTAGDTVEMQAILFATPRTMWPLSSDEPSCLLPLLNRPVLFYQLRLLEVSGFREVFLVAAAEDLSRVRSFASQEYEGQLELHVRAVDNLDGDYNASALRDLAPEISRPFVLITGPVILENVITALADLFRVKNADLAVMLLEKAAAGGGDKASKRKKKGGEDDEESEQLTGLARDGRMLYQYILEDAALEEEGDEEQLQVPKALLRRCHGLRLSAAHTDVGVYIMAAWIPKFLLAEEGEHITSIRRELVPYIVNRQLRGAAPFGGEDLLSSARGPTIEASVLHVTRQNGQADLLLSALVDRLDLGEGTPTPPPTPTPLGPPPPGTLPLASPSAEDALGAPLVTPAPGFSRAEATPSPLLTRSASGGSVTPEPQSAVAAESASEDCVRCYALSLPRGGALCMHLGGPAAYLRANRELLKWPVGPATPWKEALPRGTALRRREHSAVGSDVALGERAQMKNCVIGNGCVLADRAKLNGALLMDGVTVGASCSIQNSIVARGATIGANCKLNDCLVGPGAVVPDGTEAKEEHFLSEDH